MEPKTALWKVDGEPWDRVACTSQDASASVGWPLTCRRSAQPSCQIPNTDRPCREKEGRGHMRVGCSGSMGGCGRRNRRWGQSAAQDCKLRSEDGMGSAKGSAQVGIAQCSFVPKRKTGNCRTPKVCRVCGRLIFHNSDGQSARELIASRTWKRNQERARPFVSFVPSH